MASVERAMAATEGPIRVEPVEAMLLEEVTENLAEVMLDTTADAEADVPIAQVSDTRELAASDVILGPDVPAEMARTFEEEAEDWDEKRIYAFVMAEANTFRRHYNRYFPAYLEESRPSTAPNEKQPAAKQDDSVLTEEAEPMAYHTRRLPSGPPPSSTTLVAPGPKATALRSRLVGSLSAFVGGLRSQPWTWKDHQDYKAELCHYLDVGISVADLRAIGVLQTYSDLCLRFGFTPADLAINRLRFTANQLVDLFGVNWEQLLLDFAVGPFVYMQVLKLPLEDLASIGLSKDLLINWDARAVFERYQRQVPGDSDGYSDPHLANLHRGLDRKMFLACRHYEPDDWVLFMGIGLDDLESLGITGADLWALWHQDYATLGDILRKFGWMPSGGNNKLPRAFRLKKAPPKASRPTVSTDTSAPGSLRQFNAQQRRGDIVEGSQWDTNKRLLVDGESSEEESSNDSEELISPAPPRRPAGARTKARARRPRREVRAPEEDDSGFGDLVPAISNLLVGPPREKKRDPSRSKKPARNRKNPREKLRREKKPASRLISALNDDDDD